MMEPWQRAASGLARLAQQGADRFDPARFCYLAALVRRCADKQPAVKSRLAEKALKAMVDYQQGFEAERKAAAQQVDRIAGSHPEKAGPLKRRLEQCDYRGVRRMADSIDRQSASRFFSPLNDQMALAGRLAQANTAQFSLDALLRLQEEQIVRSLDATAGDQESALPPPDDRLRAFDFFEAAWARHHAEALVTHAIGHLPENPGHLNSQMLVTRCLTAMRKLAPAYLRRWVSYMETLLWLAGAGGNDAAHVSKGRSKG